MIFSRDSQHPLERHNLASKQTYARLDGRLVVFRLQDSLCRADRVWLYDRENFRFLAWGRGRIVFPILRRMPPMAFQPPTPTEIDRAVRAWMASAAPVGANLDSAETFADIEQLSLRIGRAVACQLAEQALQKQAAELPAETPCPQCGQACRLTRHPRPLTTVAGQVTYNEPASHCGVCRRNFFRPANVTGSASRCPGMK